VKLKPCDKCKKNKSCNVVEFLLKNYTKSPWELESYFYKYFIGVSIIFAISGNLDNIELECEDYKPINKEVDYSHLINNSKIKTSKSSKCDSCKGKCK